MHRGIGALGGIYINTGRIGGASTAVVSAAAAIIVIVAITIGAVSEAFILAGAGGADRGKVRDALQGGFASSRILSEHGLRMVERDFEPGGPARFQVKDLVNALKAADRLKLDLPITKLLHRLFDEMVESGDGGRHHSALLEHLEKVSGA